jgi:hypothetical protein
MLENTEGIIKRTIQRNWQHRIHKTQDNYMLENTEGIMKKDNPEVLCLVYPMLPVSLDCSFTLPLRYSLTYVCPVSCVSYVASFSGLFFYIAPSDKTQDKYMLENTDGAM